MPRSKVARSSVVFLLLLFSFPALAQTVSLTPTSLTFSSQALTTTSASKTVTLKNVGKGTLNITSMTASGGFGTTTCPATIAAGASCQFSVTFSPNALGTVNGAVTLVDNANPTTQVVSLTGTGIAPVTLSPTSLTFSPTAIGTTSAPKSVTLTNNLPTSLTMGGAAPSGDYNVSSNGCTGSVTAGGTCTIAVTFSPSLKGAIAGALTINNSAPFQPQTVALSGSGTGTVTNTISFTPNKLTFSNQAIGTTSAGQTVKLKNTGKTSLTVASVLTIGNYLESDTCSGKTINPQGTCTITVQFQPSIDGMIAGAITVSDNAATTPQTVGLTGTGTGSFSFSPTSLNFFLQTSNLPSAPLTATLTNDSGVAIPISGIAVTGDYSQTNNCGSTLAANSSCVFTVTYTPVATGTSDGAITVSGSGAQGVQVLSLTGSGVNPERYAYSITQYWVEAYAADPASGYLRSTAFQTLPDLCGSNNTAAVAPSGNFFYVPSQSTCTLGGPIGVFAYSIAPNGQITPITGSPFNVGSTYPYQITLTPNGKFGYVTDLSSTPPVNIIPVSVNAKTGAVAPLSGTVAYPGNNIPSPAIDPGSKFLFLADTQVGNVYAYTINSTTGALTLVSGSPFSTAAGATTAIEVHPSGKFLVTLSASGPSVFKINAQTGALTLVPGSPFSALGSGFLALDPSGNFVYVALSSTAVTVSRLNPTTGALTQVAGSPFSTGGQYNYGLTIDPSGHFLYLGTSIPSGGTPLWQLLSVNSQTGALTPVTTTGSVPFGNTTIVGLTTGAKPVAFTPGYAYVANSPVTGTSTQNGILQYSINPSTGMLTQVGSLFTDSDGPQVLALTPKQQYLYSSEASGILYGYSFLAGGALNRVAVAQEAVVYPTYSIVVDTSGAYLLGTDPGPAGSADATNWPINSAGGLGAYFGTYNFTGPGVAITDSPTLFGPVAISSDNNLWGLYDGSNTGAMWGSFTVGNSPSAVGVDGAGRFVYVANSADNTISGFTGNGSSLLSLNSGVPFATGTSPSAIAGDPWGRYLYVANAGSQNIWEYSIDPISGTLAPLAASPLSLGVSPNSLTVDFTGKFLYATNSGAGTISVFSLNADGSLTLQGTTKVNSGTPQSPAPTSIVTAGTAR